MGHGDHWGCVFKDTDTGISELLPVAIADGALVEGETLVLKKMSRDGEIADEPGEPTLTFGLVSDRGPYSVMVVLMKQDGMEETFVGSAYPFMPEGCIRDMVVQSVEEWDNGVEAEITGVLDDGAIVTFFDLEYFRNSGQYHEGRRVTVELAALALFAEPTEHKPIVIDDPDRVAEIRAIAGDSRTSDRIEFRTEGMAILFPAENGQASEYSFTGPVKSVTFDEVGGQTFHRAVITVLRMGDDFDLPVLIADHTRKGAGPVAGQDFSGLIWMHGRLCKERPERQARQTAEKEGLIGRLKRRLGL